MKSEERENAKLRKEKKKNSQPTVLKQLDSQKLYSLRERISIYIVASLSVLGLILISYMGIMVMITSVRDEPDIGSNIDVNLDDMLDDLENFFDSDDPDEIPTQDEADLHEYVDSDANDSNMQDQSNEDSSIMGTINANRVRFVHAPGDRDAIFFLNEGDVLTIIDFDYNIYWAHIEVTIELDGESVTEMGFVYRHFIDLE